MGARKIIKEHKKEVVQDGKTKVWVTPEFDEVKWKTYKEVAQICVNLGDGILNFGELKGGDNIGIYEETRQEWMQTLIGCLRHRLVLATCYSNLGIDALVHVINETELQLLICNGSSIKLLDSLHEQCPSLKYLVYIDKLSQESKYYKTISFEDCVKLGSEKPIKVEKPSEKEDVAVLMYTSGSTGAPKGVMIQQRNLVAFIGSSMYLIKCAPEDVYIGYLPLAHILELCAESSFLTAGGSIGYGSPRTLTDKGAKPCGDIKAICPTHMAGVPRVWETIRKGALEKVHASGYVSKYLFETAFATKIESIRTNQDTPIWNYIVFSKFAEQLGGRMKGNF